MPAHQPLLHRRELAPLLVGEVGEAQDAAREQLAVLADQVLALRLGLVVERIIGRAHVGEFGVAAGRRNAPRRQQRILRRHRLERTVGVPQPVAQTEQPPPVVARQHLVVLVEVGDVVDVHRQPALVTLRDVAGRLLQRAEVAAERKLRLVGEVLVVEHQHAVLVHAGGDRRGIGVRQRLGDVDAGDLAGEERAGYRIDRAN